MVYKENHKQQCGRCFNRHYAFFQIYPLAYRYNVVLFLRLQGDSTSPIDDDPAKMPKMTKSTLESFQNLGSGLVKTFRSFTARKQ